MLFAVIDENDKASLPQHETQLSSIRWHLSEGVCLVVHCFLILLVGQKVV